MLSYRIPLSATTVPGPYDNGMTPNITDRLPEYLAAAVEAARIGGEIVEQWRSKFRVTEKEINNLVTEADHASQKAIKEYLFGRYPDHAFVGEEDHFGNTIESTRPEADQLAWIVDPIDGTCNYVHDYPAYCVSIGLWLGNTPLVGVILDPRMKEEFTAAKGHGAFLNGQPIRVSLTAKLADALLCTGFPSAYDTQLRNLEAWKRVAKHSQSIRRTGSTALNLAYVSCGRLDGYWAYDNWSWDVAAGAVLILEAGGALHAADGAPFDPFRMDSCCTNGLVQSELLAALKG